MLALTGGTSISVVVEEMLAKAHEGDTSAWGPVLPTGGFALFAAICVHLVSCEAVRPGALISGAGAH